MIRNIDNIAELSVEYCMLFWQIMLVCSEQNIFEEFLFCMVLLNVSKISVEQYQQSWNITVVGDDCMKSIICDWKHCERDAD